MKITLFLKRFILKKINRIKNLKMKKFQLKYLSIFLIVFYSLAASPSFTQISKIENNKSTDKGSDKNIIENSKLQQDFYLIGRGDVLFLKVIGAEELNMQIKVLNDGNASLPLVGAKKIDGLTLNSATLFIEEMLSEELINPKVELNLIQTRPITISIIGEVSRPGVYKLDSSTNDLPSLISSIEKAGGLAKKADLSTITLKRKLPGEKFKYKRKNLNLKKLILEGDMTQNPYLFDGDIIKIQRAAIPDNDLLEITSSSLSPQFITVNFLGEINNPGSLRLKANSTLIDGILAAGGPTSLSSNYNFVEILRMNKDGSGFRKRYKINLSSNYSEKNNPILNNGDSIWIRKNNFSKATDALGFVADPIKDLVSIWTLFRLVD